MTHTDSDRTIPPGLKAAPAFTFTSVSMVIACGRRKGCGFAIVWRLTPSPLGFIISSMQNSGARNHGDHTCYRKTAKNSAGLHDISAIHKLCWWTLIITKEETFQMHQSCEHPEQTPPDGTDNRLLAWGVTGTENTLNKMRHGHKQALKHTGQLVKLCYECCKVASAGLQ